MTVVKQASLAADLTAIAGRESVSPGSGTEAVDGTTPKTVVRPVAYEDVCSVLRYANDEQLAVIPLGRRLHTTLGNLPSRYDIALDVTRLDQVVEFEPADLTITVQAGMTLRAIRRATAESRMMVPFDPDLPDEATVGGVLSAALSGPARMSLGTPRDFTIGLRVVTADGRLTRAGGRVVKNVAGYDLCKLYIGSLGTLGVIVEATFKTVPLPQAEQSLAFGFRNAAGACALVSRATSSGLALRSAALTREDNIWRLELVLAGMPDAVNRSIVELKQPSDDPPPPASDQRTDAAPIAARLCVPPSRLSALLAEVPRHAHVEAHPATGIVRIEASIDSLSSVHAVALKHNATCVVERCPPEVKRDIDVFGKTPPSLELMRAIKREWDPNSVLSPGRMVGKI